MRWVTLRAPVFLAAVLILLALVPAEKASAINPLPSWNEGPAKKGIISFVQAVTDKSSPAYVPPARRVAVFDNDGTLWSEQPLYFQLQFAVDQVKARVDRHAEWENRPAFKAALKGDREALSGLSGEEIMILVMETHAGSTAEEFAGVARNWLAEARHPRFKRPYTDLVFKPMLEVLDYLKAHGFKNYIISGGGIDFMRLWTEGAYGIPPERVLGSSIKTKFEIRNGRPVLVRLPELSFINDKAGKPVGINHFIGRRPIAAFGNSDGDLPMLQWTAAGPGRTFMLLVHHTDAEREWAYDRDSRIGRLDKALDEARGKGWTVVDMKKDWKSIYPFQVK